MTLKKLGSRADHRATSASNLPAERVEIPGEKLGHEEAYADARRQAMTLLDQGFHMGGVIRSNRDEWHER